MSIFKNAKTSGVEAAKDTLGGGSRIKESDIYTGTITVAYITPTKKGGTNVVLELKLDDGSQYRETFFVMNERSEIYFTSRDNKKVAYDGYTRINDICLLTQEKELPEMDVETKVLKLYDFESRSEVPREVPVLTELSGSKISVAIQQIRENKQALGEDGVYAPTNEERILNNVVAVFHPTERFTVTEGREGLEPSFWDKWLEKNQGKMYDKFKEVAARRGSARTASSTDAAPRKSMFAKK